MIGTTIAIAAVTALIALVAVLLVANLSLGNKPIDRPLDLLCSVADPAFERVMSTVLAPGLVAGNRPEVLVNGHRIFPAMLEAIRSARRSITLETYIYWSGSIGHEFSDALAERARSGVEVKVLIDWFGSRLDDRLLEQMQAAGIELQRHNPPRWNTLTRINHRTHRRLLVVDGRTGFIGGAGMGDKWQGDAEDPDHWRDSHCRVEGPVVAQLQSAFIGNWAKATGEVLCGPRYLPELQPAGNARAHVFAASPGSSKSMQLMYLMSIGSAAKSIDLSAAYFLPDEVATAALLAAARRGVRLRIIVPGRHIDKKVVRWASRSLCGPLLEAGADIHEYQPTMFHCKVMVVDALWVSVGSTNFDSRSFSINDEANLNVFDAEFAARQIEVFETDLKRAERITLADWRARSWSERLLGSAAALFTSQL